MAGIDEELRSRFTSEQQKAMLNLLFTANWLRSHEVALFKPFGISAQQFNILRILRGALNAATGKEGDDGRMKMQAVKGRMVDRAPNCTRLTDKLIAKKLVVRERCAADRRVVYVRISEKGLALLKEMDSAIGERIVPCSARLGTDDARTLNRILDHWRG
jgi:DNA-binding MarR family transcriptional regulator